MNRPSTLATGDLRRHVNPALNCLLTIGAFILLIKSAWCMTAAETRALRQETRNIFYHGFDNYMEHAFPEDELRPVSCQPLTRDRTNPDHFEINDVLGNYSLTLVDTLSTLAILASSPEDESGRNKPLDDFQHGVAALVDLYGDGSEGPEGQGSKARGFDLDSKVQVFETVIRGLGGLLSAHLFAVGELPIRHYQPALRADGGIPWDNGFVYNGQLLRLAYDLGKRILPAFHTPTGLPYPRVNLRHGTPFYANSQHNTDAEYGQCLKSSSGNPEVTETCSAGAGSLVLEFSTLSRLTGDVRFERLAKKAFEAIWSRRSAAGLVGGGIDAETGQWLTHVSHIGAGIDSFFEYAVKSYILLSGLEEEEESSGALSADSFLSIWEEAHEGIQRHLFRGSTYQHPHYIQADLYSGALRALWIDSLSAFYPGLLTLSGDVEEAIASHLLYTALWTRYSALPERWSAVTGDIEQGLRWWGGRPEFIESTWYLYRATEDPWYLHVGEMVLRDIKRRCWTRCGWAGLQDVRTGELSDRMESFFLGETAKYLFLLFDSDHPLNQLDAPYVFTTEGHPLIIPPSHPRKIVRGRNARVSTTTLDPVPAPTCPSPQPHLPLSISVTAARNDVFHAAHLARLHLMASRDLSDSPLVELATRHPNISESDEGSLTNYTFYPWTLPRGLTPPNGTSSRMLMRTTFDLNFPPLANTGVLNLGALQRVGNGIMVSSLSGLKLGMVREPISGIPGDGFVDRDSFRIQAISHVTLGRDEQVFVPRDVVQALNPVDPYFTKNRDVSMLDLILDVRLDANSSNSQPSESQGSRRGRDSRNSDVADNNSLLESLIGQISSIVGASDRKENRTNIMPGTTIRQLVPAVLPTGPGAAPLPGEEGEQVMHDVDLPWQRLYFSDETCSGPLAKSVAAEHQVIVIKRGRCSFSQKLRNIPSYAPSPTSLQLVIVVSYPENDADMAAGPGGWKDAPLPQEGHLITPLLDEPQHTPAGIARPHPVPMVMVGGGEATYELLRKAVGVGFKRRLHFTSQGLPISNLIIL